MKKYPKRILSLFLILATVFSLLSVSFVSYSAATDSVVSTDSVRLRKTPEITNDNIIDSIPKNEEVTLLADSADGWAYVQKKSGVKGYCSLNYLDVPDGSKVEFTGETTEDVNLRKGPSTDYGIIRLLSGETSFTVTDNSSELWVKVKVGSDEGYVYRQYTSLSLKLYKNDTEPDNPEPPALVYPDTPDWFSSSALDVLLSQSDTSSSFDYSLKLSLAETSVTVEQGATYTITAYTDIASTVSSVKYRTSDSSVATVSSNGTVKGISEGTATVTAYLDNNVSAQCQVTVIPSTTKPAEEPLVLSQSEVKLFTGNSFHLAVNIPVEWKTSDASVATVKDGVITAKAKGTAVITAYTQTQSAQCKVTVSAAASTISLYKTSVEIYAGKTYYNGATSSTSVSWSSSDTSVAKVQNGFITAVAPGTAVITAKNSSEEKTCMVTVKEAEPVRFAYCKPNTAAVGEEVTLYALTDTKRTAVKFEVTVGSQKVTVNATDKVKDGSAYLWSGTTTVNTAGTFSVVAYSKTDGQWQTCTSSNDAKTTIFIRKTASLTTETMEDRRASDELITLLAGFEGYSSSVYFDTIANNIPTIGYGKVIYLGDSFYNDMTKNEAYAYLVRTVNNGGFTSAVNTYLDKYNIYRNQQQFDALVSFCYNLGSSVLSNDSEFKKIFTAAVQESGNGKEAFINATDVNMRSGAGTSNSIVKTLSYGTVLILVETEPKNNWYHVKTQDGLEGYVYKDYVTKGKLTQSSEHYLSKINKADFTDQLLCYHHAGSSCIWGLLNRRVDELDVFFYGDYVRDGAKNKYNYSFVCPNNSSTKL